MRYLGIDYGAKRVGLALSDESGKVAFPHLVLKNNKNLVERVAKICAEREVEQIVLGESLNYKQEANLIMVAINKFKKQLAEATNLPVVLEPEWLTSALAERTSNGDDASAAALILQTHLDKL